MEFLLRFHVWADRRLARAVETGSARRVELAARLLAWEQANFDKALEQSIASPWGGSVVAPGAAVPAGATLH
ncbi:MAG: hypothetical protein WA840_16680 [Caulobacteraceae bacterium]